MLCNPEVIEVDQDPLGRCGRVIRPQDRRFAMAKELEDGTLAVGLFNRGPVPAAVAVTWEELGVKGPQRVRDLWRHRDLGEADGRFSAMVPRHGGVLVRLAPK